MDQKLLDEAKALAARNYQIVVEKEEASDGKATWVAYMPELPACVAEGDSLQAARNALKVLSEDYIYFRLKRGVPVPAPQQNRHSPAQQKPAVRQFNAEFVKPR